MEGVIGVGSLTPACHLLIPAQHIDELDLPGSPALRLEQRAARYDDADALCTRGRNVEAVQTEQEFETARGFIARAGRHGVDRDRGVLALEAVDGADLIPALEQRRVQGGDLSVVRRDDPKVGARKGAFTSVGG